MGIFYGIFASLSFSLFYTFLKKSYEDFPPSIAFFFDMLLGLVIWIPFSLFLGFEVSDLPQVAIYAAISALLSEAFSFYVVSKGEVSLTGTIFSSYPIYTILFALILLGETLSLEKSIVVGITLFGSLLAALPQKLTWDDFKQKSFILWAVAGAIAAGFSDTLSKGIIDQTSAAAFLFCLALFQVPLSLAYLKIEKQSLNQFGTIFQNIGKYSYSLLGALFNALGLIGLWLAFEHTQASIASPLTGS
ncbi:MAG TPA: DMT family transporter, partial [Patescibacteria group bacterium]